jgi:hypothetical protein
MNEQQWAGHIRKKKPFRTYVIYVYLGHLHTRSSTYLLSKIISKSVQAISKILIAKILFILESYKFLACLLLQLHTALSTYNYVNLINNPRMFNLAEKPYIPQKSLLLWICCKCLAWWHRHTYFWPPLRLLEAKHHTATPHFGTVGWTEHWVKVPKCAVAVWCLASNSLHGGQKCSPDQPPYLEF